MAGVSGFLALSRPVNALAAGVLTFIGAFIAGGAFASPGPVTAGVAATVLATAAGNAINDYFDREIDRVNAPSRPIPSGRVTPREALAFSGVAFAAAIALALLLPLLAIAIAALNLAALIAYTPVCKGRPVVGNLVVAYLGGSTFLFGGAAVGDPSAAVVLFALAALATVAREIVKDVEDAAGDETGGLRTLPLVVGRRAALWAATAALLVAVAASPLPYLDGTFGWAYLAVVAPADLVMLYAGAASFADPARGQRVLKYGMFLAALAFVAGRLAVT